MSLNCLTNCGSFSSDNMMIELNERTFKLSHAAIIKGVSGNTDQIDPYNGIGVFNS